jgi:hypothetical protein
MPTDQGQTVHECRLALAVPGGHRHLDQEHHRDPLQVIAVDDVRFGGTHCIPVAALGRVLASTTAFHDIVRPEDDRRAWGDQERDQQSRQDLTPLEG